MKKKSKGKQARVELLDSSKKEQMIAVLCRNPTVFGETVERVTTADLRDLNVAWAWAWRGCKQWWDEHGASLPTKAQLTTEVQQLIKDSHNKINAVEIEETQEFINLIFDKEVWEEPLATSKGYAKYALKTFNRWQQERVVQTLHNNLVAGNTLPANIVETLQGGLQEAEAAASADLPTHKPVFYEGWQNETKPQVISTGLKVFDDFLGGGWLKKEVVLFMGPYGSCKTTLAVIQVLNAAKECVELTAKSKKGKRFVAVYVSYETTFEQFRERCIQYHGQVPHSRLKQLKSWFDFDDGSGGEPQPYEKKLFAEQIDKGHDYPCELARVNGTGQLVNDHVIFVDFSGADPNNPGGMGGLDELAARLRKIKKEEPNLVFRLVVVDHVAAMVNAMVAGEVIQADKRRETLKDLPKQFRDQVGGRHNCPVLLLHQLSGAANARGPTAVFHYTDSDECKSIGMFTDFALCTGPTTQDGRMLAIWDCSKHRREPPRRRQVVRVVGEFNKIVGVGHKYVVDPGTNKIISAEEYQKMHGELPSDYAPKGDAKDGDDDVAGDPNGPDDPDGAAELPATKASAKKTDKKKPKKKVFLGEAD